jgi:hypothetical protein
MLHPVGKVAATGGEESKCHYRRPAGRSSKTRAEAKSCLSVAPHKRKIFPGIFYVRKIEQDDQFINHGKSVQHFKTRPGLRQDNCKRRVRSIERLNRIVHNVHMGLPLHASKNEESKDLARWHPQGLNQQQGMQGQRWNF